jgi:DNA-directed RNA polymerase specialized sigma subunit
MNDENKCKKSCDTEEDRSWIDYPEDNNCIYEAIRKNGPMTLEQVALRLGISLVRVSQIEKQALKKLSKRIKL